MRDAANTGHALSYAVHDQHESKSAYPSWQLTHGLGVYGPIGRAGLGSTAEPMEKFSARRYAARVFVQRHRGKRRI